MSNPIQGKGKPRRNGQDLNSNAMSMGGGQMVMPPNGAAAAFATPIISQSGHAPEYAHRPQQYGIVDFTPPQPMSGTQGGPSMVLPPGTSINMEQPSQYATMQGLPQNMRNAAPINPNMQWTGVPQQQQQPQQQQMMNSGMMPHHMASRPQHQGRPSYPPQPQQQQMAYFGSAPAAYGYAQPGMYTQQYPQPDQAAYAAYAQQQYNQQYQQQQQQSQMMYQQHMQTQHQTGVPPTMQQMPAPPAQQPQQGGGGGGAASGGPSMGGGSPHNQQQTMHGQVPPVSGSQPMHQGGSPQTAPSAVPQGTFNPTSYPQPQTQQPRPAPPLLEKKKRNILAIVNPDTNETLNQNAVEASKKDEDDAPKAEKEEATDEVDLAKPEIKKQFAEQMLEQTATAAKSEQSAPAPTPVVAPTTAAPPAKKCLFSLDQLKELKLEEVKPHVPAPPIPVFSTPSVASAPTEKKKPSEYLPEPLPAPAYPNNYKEKQTKQSSPDTTLTEMPATHNDEQPDLSHLLTPETTPPHVEPASSSSDKNTSNDSAICVQTPITPPPTTETEKTVEESQPETVDETIVAVEEEEEEKKVDETEEEDLSTKLEHLVIVEPSSQDEAEESEPSTPAPVTPSVSETTALDEQEEDAEQAAAAAEEARQQKRAELEAAIAANEEDIEQFDESIGKYNREYLYNVRDIEKLFAITVCPLTPEELKNFGVCRSQARNEMNKKQDGQGGFMPPWGQRSGGGGGGGPRSDRKAYQGRQSEQHHRGGGQGGGSRQGSNKKLPPSIRPSIERRVDTSVQLHKAEKAWKVEKVAEVDLEDAEVKKKLLLKNIRSLFNKITPTTKDALINEFLDYKVYQSPSLNEVISVIFDKAVEEPKFCPLYSSMCQTQVGEELKLNNNVSEFRNAILARAQDTFTTKTLDEFINQKEEEINAETDEKKKKEKQIELLEAKSKFRRRKFGNITFIGQLYLHNLISVRIIIFCVVDLLKTVTEKPADLTGYEADEESVDCAVRLLETIGKRLHDNNMTEQKNAAAAAAVKAGGPKTIQRGPVKAPAPPQATFPLDVAFQTLEGAVNPTQIVSSRIKFMIMNLVELRKMGWVARKGTDAGPKKLDEIKKDIAKEAMENLQATQNYERKQSRQEGGRGQMGYGGGGQGGHGGHGGGHGNNPKRQIIQRNSTDRGTVEERRTQAHKSSSLATRGAPQKKASLSSVTTNERPSLGGREKNKWSGGASGGSENSKKEDRAAAIQIAGRINAMNQHRSSSAASMKGADDDGASASGNATQVNSEDERELNEQREKQEADLTKRIISSVGDYATEEIKLEEARDEVLATVGEEKYGKPSIQTVFKCFMAAAIRKGSTKDGFETVNKFGYVLAFSLLKKHEEKDIKGRDDILKGVADSCKDIVQQEQWEDAPKIWDIVAEVLINAHVPEDGLFVGAHPTLEDFSGAFFHAAKDTRKPYTLFVLVLKRLAEIHHKRDKDNYLEVVSWVLDECKTITKSMEVDKLNKALTATEMSWGKNLHDIMRQDH